MNPNTNAQLERRQMVGVFLAFAFAYFLSTLMRAITATLSPALTQELALSAQDLGLLAGGYFLGFSVTQLPLGKWLDLHGPKKVILSFLVVAVLGCICFAMAQSFVGLWLARVLCGVGVSACLMSPLTGYRRWMDPGSQLRANSWMLMTGSLGMLSSTLPVQWLMPITGWRAIFAGLAVLVVVAMLMIYWIVPAWEKPAPTAAKPVDSDAGYGPIWRSAYFWRMAPIGFFCYAGMLAVQTLWAGPWMTVVGGYTPDKVALRRAINLAVDVQREIDTVRRAEQLLEPFVVERRRLGQEVVRVVGLGILAGRQQLDAEIRREHHGDQPRRQQREADHPEDVAGVLAGAGLGEADRHQADRGQHPIQREAHVHVAGVGAGFVHGSLLRMA